MSYSQVDDGIKFFDENFPGWALKVDLLTFNLGRTVA